VLVFASTDTSLIVVFHIRNGKAMYGVFDSQNMPRVVLTDSNSECLYGLMECRVGLRQY
jgi:hypothetical protein